MKVKTICRIGGFVDAAVWSPFVYINYKVLSQIDYNNLANFFSGDYAFEYKLSQGIVLGTQAVFSLITALGVTDGLVDIVKGTHHYVFAKAWQKLTRNKERKEKIEKMLEEMLERRENPLPHKKQA